MHVYSLLFQLSASTVGLGGLFLFFHLLFFHLIPLKLPIISTYYSRIILNIISSFAYKHMQEDRNTVTIYYIGA